MCIVNDCSASRSIGEISAITRQLRPEQVRAAAARPGPRRRRRRGARATSAAGTARRARGRAGSARGRASTTRPRRRRGPSTKRAQSRRWIVADRVVAPCARVRAGLAACSAALLDLLAPPACWSCGGAVHAGSRAVPRVRLGAALGERTGAAGGADGPRRPHAPRRSRSPGPARDLVHALKFRDAPAVAALMAAHVVHALPGRVLRPARRRSSRCPRTRAAGAGAATTTPTRSPARSPRAPGSRSPPALVRARRPRRPPARRGPRARACSGGGAHDRARAGPLPRAACSSTTCAPPARRSRPARAALRDAGRPPRATPSPTRRPRDRGPCAGPPSVASERDADRADRDERRDHGRAAGARAAAPGEGRAPGLRPRRLRGHPQRGAQPVDQRVAEGGGDPASSRARR